jgi:hypothetical protein
MGDINPFVLVKFEYEDTSRFFIASRYEANIILNNNIGFRNRNDDIITINRPPPTNDDEFFVIVYNNPPPPPPGAGANRIRIIPLPPNDVPEGGPDAAAAAVTMAELALQEPGLVERKLTTKETYNKLYERLRGTANLHEKKGGRRKSSAKKRASRRKPRSAKKRASRRYRHRRRA